MARSGLIAADTTFLIDLQRDDREVRSALRSFLSAHRTSKLCVSVTALGEFAAGFLDPHQGAYVAIRQRFELSPHDEEVALCYGTIFRDLKSEGQLIGGNDLWIAASALRHGAALVTRNVEEFSRVPNLKVLRY